MGPPQGHRRGLEGLGTTGVARATGSNAVIYMVILDFLMRPDLLLDEAAQGHVVGALRKRPNGGAGRQTYLAPAGASVLAVTSAPEGL